MDKLKAFELLGLAQNADEDAIKQAYRKLAQDVEAKKTEDGADVKALDAHMDELNAAFDRAISAVRGLDAITGSATAPQQGPFVQEGPLTRRPGSEGDEGYAAGARYPEIRKLINQGKLDEAVAELSSVLGGANDAEWNFLMGSVYYYKGWLEQAFHYFSIAVKLNPENREYQAALKGMQKSAEGEMPGNPYTAQDSGTAAVNCACRTCSLMCCLDMCCNGCRGM